MHGVFVVTNDSTFVGAGVSVQEVYPAYLQKMCRECERSSPGSVHGMFFGPNDCTL